MTGAPLAAPHGFGDDERSRTLRQRPPAAAVRWVEEALRVRVLAMRAYRGGSSASLHALRVEHGEGGGVDTVVLRRYVLERLNAEEPDIAEREARTLRILERCTVPTPRLLAVDPTGDEAGCPALVMSRVPGRLDWSPTDTEPWLRHLAALLPPIHATQLDPADAGDRVQPFRPYVPESGFDPPPWVRDTRVWECAVELFHAPPLDRDAVFIHRDFHPGNVLWRRGRTSGVVDWQAASVGPRAVDVFHCRANLFSRFGMDVADRFVAIWEDVSGETYHPWAEAVMLVDAMGWTGPRTERHRRGLEDLLARRLAELGVA